MMDVTELHDEENLLVQMQDRWENYGSLDGIADTYDPFDGGAQRYELAANGGDAQAQFATGWFLMTGTGVPQDERKGLKWIHKATFQGYQPAIDYCKEHGYKWY